ERGRRAEVVHRRTDHHDVRSQELLQRGRAACGAQLVATRQDVAGQMRDRVALEVTDLDFQPTLLGLPTCDDGGSQLTGDRVVPEYAGIELQQLHGLSLSGWRLPRGTQ